MPATARIIRAPLLSAASMRLPSLITRSRVPTDLAAVTTINYDAEVAPRAVEVADDGVERIWSAVERLYRSGIHPAIQLCVRRRGAGADRPRHRPRRAATGPTTRRDADKVLATTGDAVQHLLGLEGGDGDGHPPARPAPPAPPRRSGVRVHPRVRASRQSSGSPSGTCSPTAPASPTCRPRRWSSSRSTIRDGIVRAPLRRRARPGARAASSPTTPSPAASSSARSCAASPARHPHRPRRSEILRPLGFRWMNYGVAPRDVRQGRASTTSPGRRRCRRSRPCCDRALGVRLPTEAIALSNDPRFLTARRAVRQRRRHRQRAEPLLPAAAQRRQARRRAHLRAAHDPARHAGAVVPRVRPHARCCRSATAWASCSAASGSASTDPTRSTPSATSASPTSSRWADPERQVAGGADDQRQAARLPGALLPARHHVADRHGVHQDQAPHGARPPAPAAPEGAPSPPPMTTRSRKFWGWGYEGEGPTARAAGTHRASCSRRASASTPPAIAAAAAHRRDRAARRRASRRRRRWRRICSRDAARPRRAHLRQVVPRRRARASRATSPTRPTSSRFPRDEARRRRAARLVQPTRARRRDPVRRRLERRRRRRARRAATPTAARCRSTSARLDRVLEIDRTSRAARIQAGVLGPALEDQLRPHGLHAAPLPAVVRVLDARRLDRDALGRPLRDAVHAHRRLRRVAARGHADAASSSRAACPARAPGPSPDRLFIGSEGILGIITEAWMRLQDRPTLPRLGVGHASPTSLAGARGRARDRAGRPLPVQLPPARSPARRCSTGAGTGGDAVLLLAFESADHALDAWMARALECARDHGGRVPRGRRRDAARRATARARAPPAPGGRRSSARRICATRSSAMGMISETFETAITWDRFAAFHAAVMARDRATRCGASAAPGTVTCRFTHVYPDGPAPYYSVIAPGRARQPARAVGRDQGRGVRRDHRARRHDHAPPRRRPRSPPVVRPPAARRLRARARAPRSARSIRPGS